MNNRFYCFKKKIFQKVRRTSEGRRTLHERFGLNFNDTHKAKLAQLANAPKVSIDL